jgi:hypothetical protein
MPTKPPDEVSADRAIEARYVNYFEVGHNPFEFVIDFGQYHHESRAAHLHTRIVTGPVYAKTLAAMLLEAVKQYEAERGVIEPVADDIDPLEVVKASIDGYERRWPQGDRNG